MKLTTSKNKIHFFLKKVSIGMFLSYLMILSVKDVSAASFILYYSCFPKYCPQASAIYISLDLDKTDYAPNESVTLFGSADSDDNPQPPGKVSPIGRGTAGIFRPSIDIFPNTYTNFEMTNGLVNGSVILGNAPSSQGRYFTPVFGGAGGYISQGSKNISFNVVGSCYVETKNGIFVDKSFTGDADFNQYWSDFNNPSKNFQAGIFPTSYRACTSGVCNNYGHFVSGQKVNNPIMPSGCTMYGPSVTIFFSH